MCVPFSDAGQWVVQGRGGTNPLNKKKGIRTAAGPVLKIKTGFENSGVVSPDKKPVWLEKVAKRVKPSKQVNNNDTASETHETVPDPTSAGDKGTVRTNNKVTVTTVKSKGTILLDMGGEKPFLAELPTDRFNLEKWK